MHDWTLMRKLIVLKAAVLSGAAAVWQTVSGAVASFTTLRSAGLKSLVVDIDPVQSGSGNPAPATKNLFNSRILANWTINGDGTDANSVSRSAAFDYTPVSAGTAYTLSYSESIENGVFYYDADRTFLSYLAWGSNPRTFTTPANTAFVRFSFKSAASLTNIQLELGSTATDYTAPGNVRPITGRTSANATVAGKNLLNPHLYTGGTYNPSLGYQWTLTDSPLQFTANADSSVYTLTTSATWQYYTMLVPVVQGESYMVKAEITSSGELGTSFGYLDADYKVISKTNNTGSSQTWSYNPTPTVGGGAAYYYIVISNRGTAAATITLTEPQIELSSPPATAYEAYQGSTVSVDWSNDAGTVYGGTLDVVSGVLTVTMANIASYNGETLPSTWMSDRDVYAVGTTPTTGAQVVYTLATPQT